MNDFLMFLQFSLNYCPDQLITKSNKQVLLNLAGKLPDTFARFLFGYEKDLLDDSGELDISVSINNKNPLYNFGSCFKHQEIIKLCEAFGQWQKLKNLSDEWLKQDELLYKYLEMIALEFDFSRLKENNFVPSVFLGIESIPYLGNPNYKAELFERTKVFISSIEILSGIIPDRRITGYIDEITNKSVNLFHIFQAGLMLSRDNSPVRICIRKMDDPNYVLPLSEYLFDGKFLPGIKYIIEKFGGYFDRFAISLNVTDSGVEKISIECSYDRKKQPLQEPRWKQMFDALCGCGFCRKEIAESIINYPLKEMIIPNLTNSINNEYPRYYVQGLHHIKFTSCSNNSLTAKAYMWSGFYWNKEK